MNAIDPTPLEEARALVERWEQDQTLSHPWPELNVQRINLTKLVKAKLASDIAGLINDKVRRERYTAS